MNYCRDCKSSAEINSWNPICKKWNDMDVVYKRKVYKTCKIQRLALGECGVDGDFFEQKFTVHNFIKSIFK